VPAKFFKSIRGPFTGGEKAILQNSLVEGASLFGEIAPVLYVLKSGLHGF